jgi:outer membrane receptor protein involved in Fe transport
LSIDDFEDSVTDRTQVNPKLGITWDLTQRTTLRGAAFRTLKRTLISSQTIEPTQVAGFNQFFDDTTGTDSWTFGVGLDQELGDDVLVGAEVVARRLSVSIEDAFGQKRDFDTDETVGRAYFYWAPADWVATNAEYQYEERDDEEFAGAEQMKIRTQTVPLELRFFHPSGVFAGLRGTFVYQDGRFENLRTGELESDSDQFWVADATVGYRLSNRYGLIALEARNLFDERFRFQDFDFDRID